MDEELRQLDLAVAETRRLATDALDALHKPKAALRKAAADYVESVARRRIDASRRSSVGVMAKLSDADVVELRLWADEDVARIRSAVESEIESCDFWISETSGLSLTDVHTYGAAVVPRPKDSKSGIPQSLVFLFELHLRPLLRGLAAVGLASATADAEPVIEATLVRAWRKYLEVAVDCLVKWADIDDRYQASAARFQEMRWELAGEADSSAATAMPISTSARTETDTSSPRHSVRVDSDAIARKDPETLIPMSS